MPHEFDPIEAARNGIIAMLKSLKKGQQSSLLIDDPQPGQLTREQLHALLDAMLDLGQAPPHPVDHRLLWAAGNVLLCDACAPLRPKHQDMPKGAHERRALFVQALAQTPSMLPPTLRRDVTSALMVLNTGRTPELLVPSRRRMAIEAKRGIEQWALSLIEFFVGCGHPRRKVREVAMDSFGIAEPTLRAWKKQMLADNPGRTWASLAGGLNASPRSKNAGPARMFTHQGEPALEFQKLAAEWRALGGTSRKSRSDT